MPDEVRAYILDRVLVPNEDWERGLLSGELNVERTSRSLNDALQLVISRYGNQFPSPEEVNVVFHEAFEDECWFPLLIC